MTTLYARVKVASSTTGTGSYTLGSAIPSFRDFSIVANGAVVSYLAEQGTDYEYGSGLFTAPATLARTTISGSSNGGNAVNWASPPTISLSPNEADLQAGTSANQLVRLDGTGKITAALLPAPTLSSIGGVKARAVVSREFLTGIGTDGTIYASEMPAASLTNVGGVFAHANVANQFLTGIGADGSVFGRQPYFSDLSGQIAPAQLIAPTASTLGGVTAHAAVANQFLTGINADGSVAAAQPAFSNLSGSPSVAQSAANGSWVLLNTVTSVNASSLLDATSMTASYYEYEIRLSNITTASTNVILEMVFIIGGVPVYAGYSTSTWIFNNLASALTTPTGYIDLTGGARFDNSSQYNATLRISYPYNTGYKKSIFGSGFYMNGAFPTNVTIGAASPNTSAVTGVGVFASTGNITGTMSIYGRKA